MSSLKMTFSLTSLILIFALAFVATPVMAATGGPTPTITQYSGLEDPNAAAGATNQAHEQERDDFRLQVTFDALVEADLAESGFTVSVAEAVGKATEVTTTSGITAVTAITRGANANKAYMVVVNLDSTTSTSHTAGQYSFGYISFVVNADQVDGTQAGHSTNGLGNVRSAAFELTSDLPKANDWTVTATLGTNAPEIADNMFTVPAAGADPNSFTVLLTLSGGTGAVPGITDLTQIQIRDGDGGNVSFPTTTTVAQAGLVSTITFTITAGDAAVATPIFVGINPNWANAMPVGGLKIPADDAPGKTAVDPTVDIALFGAVDETAKTFEVKFTFEEATVDAATETAAAVPGTLTADQITLQKEDPDDAMEMIDSDAYVEPNGIIKTRDGVFLVTVNYRADALPVYVGTSVPVSAINGTVLADLMDDDPRPTLKVGEADPGTTPPPANAPAKPDAPTAMINADNDLVIDVSWTAPADGGSAITGYTVKKYGSDGMLVKTFPETGDDPITDTMLAVGPIPEADRGMSFTFTVTAMNANGSGPESDMSTAVMVPEAPTVPNNPPFFPAGSAIADIVIWKGHAYTTPVLPKASDDEGDELGDYTITPDLPAGLRLVANDVQDRTITGTATVASAKTAHTFSVTDAAGATAELSFNLTVLEPIVPTAPTIVSAMEEGDLGGLPANIARTVNTNKVVTNWTAPVDKTETSHVPAIPFGAKISGYMVTRVNKADSISVTYPRPNDEAIKADATMHTTPDVLNLGTYGLKVAAVNSVGKGAYSDSEDVLVADPPQPPTDLRASKVPADPNSTTLDWLLPKNDGGLPIVGYVIYQTLDGGPEIDIQIAPATTHKVSNLKAGRHVFRIAAFNEDGLGERSISTAFSVDVPLDPTNIAPSFGDKSINHITATAGTAITGVTLPAATDADSDTIRYSISPVLPTGLRFNASTRYLSGTPTTVMASRVYTYTASDGKGGTAALNFSIEVKSAPTTPDVPPVTTLPPGTAHITGSYDAAMGVVTLSGSIAANGFGVVMADILPNLEDFFSRGGTITLDDGADTAAKTVVVSEILWGLDLGEPAATQKNRQFIELYNTNISGGAAVSVTGWTLSFQEGRPAPANDVDQVSNVDGTGWIVDVGQSGRVTGTTLMGGNVAPMDIISMYRNITYAKVQNTDGGDAAKRLEGVPGGNGKGAWKASTRVTTNAGVKSSPGRQHFKTVIVLTPTAVPRTPFVINEIGNGSGGTNDWIEFRNVTATEQSLKNYQLSVVTGTNADDKKDTQLFHFHDKDFKVPANGVIVVYSTHPRNTDLAQGKDVSVDDKDEENRGASHLFVVRSFDLPDSGKNLLILRKSAKSHEKQHLGTPNDIIDVVGALGIAIKTADFETKLWPLSLAGAPHGNVIDGQGSDEFSAGKVYTRGDAGGGTGEKDIGIAGYTGLGYDRAATPNGANGGTPGYDNGAIKGKIAELASDAEVTFSEIMLDVGEGRVNLPQWIEIYNNSMTHAVNTNGWKLHIENHNDVDTALDAVLTLGDMKIGPNQTVLIVTNSGRVSDPDHFPSNRVVNLWTTKAHRDALGTSKRTEKVFSTTGLYLKLTDADNKLVDEFGNLDGNRRTREDPKWTIPMAQNGEGRRSSLIRVYDSDDDPSTAAVKHAKGTVEDAWVLADTTSLAFAISQTYFGDPDDYGTPGFRGGGPLPVSLSKFRPERLDSGEIVVRWITESELNNAGFNILRSEKRDGEFTKVHFEAGQGTTSERTAYEWKDTTANKPNVVYYYQIQDVSLDGEVTTLRQSRLKGDVTPTGKLTTTWGDIKALQ